eukprot:4743878-Prymnesium_polylepis.3
MLPSATREATRSTTCTSPYCVANWRSHSGARLDRRRARLGDGLAELPLDAAHHHGLLPRVEDRRQGLLLVEKDAVIPMATRAIGPAHARGVGQPDATAAVRLLPAATALVRHGRLRATLGAGQGQVVKVKLLARVKDADTLTVGDERAATVARADAKRGEVRALLLVTSDRRRARRHPVRGDGGTRAGAVTLRAQCKQSFFGNLP